MMMYIFQISIFSFLCYGLGKLFAKQKFKLLEAGSLGLASIPVLGVILNTLHIPLDWRIFLGLAMIVPSYQFLQWWKGGREFPTIKLKRPSWQTLVLIVVLIFTAIIYCWGPFTYDWFEDDDPWSHAAGIKYIALERNLNVPDGVFQYLNPYPPGYDMLFGILHQVSPSLYGTVKFFNGFIICLGFLFFYLFAQEFTQNKSKAALATFFLALIPCYLTHFIWAHSLVITLFFPAFYFLLKSLKDKQYIIPAGICWAAVTLVQPTQPIKFAIMAGLLLLAYRRTKIQWKNVFCVILIAAALASLWWGPVIIKSITGHSDIALRAGEKITGTVSNTSSVFKGILSPTLGTATQRYSWQHFLFISDPNLITNPVGLTTMIVLLSLIGLYFAVAKLMEKNIQAEKPYLWTTILWLIFTFLGINSMTFNLPVGLFAFRFWMLFAIPVAFLCAEGLYSFVNFLEFKWNKIVISILIILATIRVTLPFKWWFNTNEWSYGVHWVSDEDINGYVWLRKTLPVNTKVFTFTDNILVLGHDMRADFWSGEYKTRFAKAFEQDISTLYHNLNALQFDCLVISPRDIREFGREGINKKLEALVQDSRFKLIFSNKAVKIFQVMS